MLGAEFVFVKKNRIDNLLYIQFDLFYFEPSFFM